MGFRNPFRMSVDKPTGIVYVGDYGPDAGAADPARGPAGQVEFARVTEAGQLRLAVLHRRQRRLRRLRLRAPGRPATTFDCAAPKNDLAEQHRPDRPARRRRPPGSRTTARPYPSSATAPSPRWAAPSTATTPTLDSPVKFPEAYDGDFFAGEFGRRWIKRIEQDDDGAVAVHQRLPVDRHPGDGHGLRPGRRAVRPRLRHRAGSAATRTPPSTASRTPPTATRPVAEAAADRTSGQAPLKVDVLLRGHHRRRRRRPHATAGTSATAAPPPRPNPTHTYKENGTYTATVTAKDPERPHRQRERPDRRSATPRPR